MAPSVRSRGPGGRRSATDLPKILDAAMALIRSEGLEALTMRRLAESLGVWTTTLYHHVGADKDQLLKLVVDAIAATVARPPRDVVWDERLRRLLHEMHAALREYPGVAAYLLEAGVPGPNGILINESLALAIGDSGLPIEEAARVDFMLATLLFADAQQHETPTAAAVQEKRDACFERDLATLPEGAPTAAELYRLSAAWPASEYLDWVIDVVIAHIRAVTTAAAR